MHTFINQLFTTAVGNRCCDGIVINTITLVINKITVVINTITVVMNTITVVIIYYSSEESPSHREDEPSSKPPPPKHDRHRITDYSDYPPPERLQAQSTNIKNKGIVMSNVKIVGLVACIAECYDVYVCFDHH